MLRQSVVWDYEHGELIPAIKLARLFGYPVQELAYERYSDHFLTQMVGDAFALMCVGPVLTAYLMNPLGPWWAHNQRAPPTATRPA